MADQHVMTPGTTFVVNDYPAEVAAAIRGCLPLEGTIKYSSLVEH